MYSCTLAFKYWQCKAITLFSFSIAWDQSDKFVKIYLTDLKNVQSLSPEDFEFEAKTSSVYFVAKNLNGRNCIFEVKELASKINPEKSEYKVKSGIYFF